MTSVALWAMILAFAFLSSSIALSAIVSSRRRHDWLNWYLAYAGAYALWILVFAVHFFLRTYEAGIPGRVDGASAWARDGAGTLTLRPFFLVSAAFYSLAVAIGLTLLIRGTPVSVISTFAVPAYAVPWAVVMLRRQAAYLTGVDGAHGIPDAFIADYRLTPRECEVVRDALSGLSNVQIAEHHHIALKTVETHLHNVYRRPAQAAGWRWFGWSPLAHSTLFHNRARRKGNYLATPQSTIQWHPRLQDRVADPIIQTRRKGCSAFDLYLSS